MDLHAFANGGYGGPLSMPMGTDCAVHKHRETVPMEKHHIWPIGMGGLDVPENRVVVCANGHYSIHEYMRQLILKGGESGIPWTQRRLFGKKVRKFAVDGWEQAGAPRHTSPGE